MLVEGENGIFQITVSESSRYGYSYKVGQEKLLADYAAKASKVTFSIISQKKKVRGRGPVKGGN